MTLHQVDDIADYLMVVIDKYESIPWAVLGIFPTEDSAGAPEAWWNSFCYTRGLTPHMDMWVPSASIEGRYAGPQLTSQVLNVIAAAVIAAVVHPGDSVAVPLGVPDGGDVETVWWLGKPEPNRGYRATYQSQASSILPMLWTSPLGWRSPEEPCQRGTVGCSVDHQGDENCETW
jgi:hypothetical protein